MFEGLKKKFAEFADSFGRKEKEKIEEVREEETVPPAKTEREAESRPKREEHPKKEPEREQEAEAPRAEHEVPHVRARAERPAEAKSKEKKPDVSFATKLKGAFLVEVKISEKDVDPFLEQLRMALLQTDVNYDVAEKIVERMRANMVGSRMSSRGIASGIRGEMRSAIMEIMSKNRDADIVKLAVERKAAHEIPFKVLFIGPNGAGKTTTIAKMASMLGERGVRCVVSASDTFRAAAIEQAVFHAKKLGVDVVKGSYGADPTSVAFDAIAYAKAHGADAVLIDTAGRQETNRSLIEELRKMVRVNKPDLCIFVGEGIAGNALLDQVRQFNEALKLDGIILTKLDCDAKGGNTLSILSETTVPVLYFGTGEKYGDLIPYDPKFVVDSIVPED